MPLGYNDIIELNEKRGQYQKIAYNNKSSYFMITQNKIKYFFTPIVWIDDKSWFLIE